MTITLNSVFDDEVLRFDEPIQLERNARGRVTIKTAKTVVKKKHSYDQEYKLSE